MLLKFITELKRKSADECRSGLDSVDRPAQKITPRRNTRNVALVVFSVGDRVIYWWTVDDTIGLV